METTHHGNVTFHQIDGLWFGCREDGQVTTEHYDLKTDLVTALEAGADVITWTEGRVTKKKRRRSGASSTGEGAGDA